MESIIFTTDASIVLAELLGGIRHENLFIVADKHTVGFVIACLRRWIGFPLT